MLSLKPSMKNLDTSAEIDPDTCYFKLAKKKSELAPPFYNGQFSSLALDRFFSFPFFAFILRRAM